MAPKLSFDVEAARKAIVEFIRAQVEGSGAHGVVLGLSGGVDSSTAAFLCREALGSERVLGLIMPDSDVTPEEDVRDAEYVAELLRIEAVTVDIAPVVRSFAAANPLYGGDDIVALGNVRARVRMLFLYYAANRLKRLVCGTGDRSEIMIGYFTKYGDGAADIMPLACLYKTQVRELAAHLGVPRRIATKPSSPRLWPGQTAEGELGMSYEVIDAALHALCDLELSVEEAAKVAGLSVEEVGKVKAMIDASEHKRQLPKAPPPVKTELVIA